MEKQIIDYLEENFDDFEILNFGTTIIKLATKRLDKDLDNKEIKEEYNKLNDIIYSLEKILENYK